MSFTDRDAWHFKCCQPHQTRSQEWLLEILHQFWNHGMDFRSFQYGDRAPLTWEELLVSTGEVSGRTFGPFTGTFTKCVAKLIQAGGTFTTDNGISWLYLSFRELPNSHLDWLSLFLAGNEATCRWAHFGEEEGAENLFLNSHYLEAYQGLVEWSKLLCEIVEPLFGFGYRNGEILDSELPDAYLRFEGEEILRGQLPEVERWFSAPPLRYLAPALWTKETVNQWLAHEHWQIERLITGGLFFTPAHSRENSFAHNAYTRLRRAKHHKHQLAKTDISTRDTTSFDVLAREAAAEVRRARTTFTLLHEQRGISEADMLGLSFLP